MPKRLELRRLRRGEKQKLKGTIILYAPPDPPEDNQVDRATATIPLGHTAFWLSPTVPGIVGQLLPWRGGVSTSNLRELMRGFREPCTRTRRRSRGLREHGRRMR